MRPALLSRSAHNLSLTMIKLLPLGAPSIVGRRGGGEMPLEGPDLPQSGSSLRRRGSVRVSAAVIDVVLSLEHLLVAWPYKREPEGEGSQLSALE
jgi:hypothetical protein